MMDVQLVLLVLFFFLQNIQEQLVIQMIDVTSYRCRCYVTQMIIQMYIVSVLCIIFAVITSCVSLQYHYWYNRCIIHLFLLCIQYHIDDHYCCDMILVPSRVFFGHDANPKLVSGSSDMIRGAVEFLGLAEGQTIQGQKNGVENGQTKSTNSNFYGYNT